MSSPNVKAALVMSAAVSLLALAYFAMMRAGDTPGCGKSALEDQGSKSDKPETPTKKKKTKKKKGDKKSAVEDGNGLSAAVIAPAAAAAEPNGRELSAADKEQVQRTLEQLQDLNNKTANGQLKKEATGSNVNLAPPQPVGAQAAPDDSAMQTDADVFIHSIVSRAALTQPLELMAASNPKKATKKRKQLTSWEELFVEALQALESNEAGAVNRSAELLNLAEKSAPKPGAPKEAITITYCGKGYLNAVIGKIKEAERMYKLAVKEADKRGQDLLLASCYRDLGVLARESKKWKMAILFWQKALSLQENPSTKAFNGDELERSKQCVEIKMCVADCQWEDQQQDQCEQVMRECLQWREENLGVSDALTFAGCYDLSRVLRLQGKQQEASSLDERWQQGLMVLCENDARKYADMVSMLASMSQVHKHYEEALLQFQHAQPHLKATSDPDSVEYGEFLNELGQTLGELERVEEAKQTFHDASQIFMDKGPEQQASLALVQANMAKVLSKDGQQQEASQMFEQAEQTIHSSLMQANLPQGQVLLARVLHMSAAHQEELGNTQEAAEKQEAMHVLEEKYGFIVQ